ncbi:MAG: phenylacetic acid degradation bifunctional protein PaaZ [Actinomycetota bacterium]
MTTTTALSSLIADEWVVGSGDLTPLLDASTGATVASLAGGGLDFDAAVAHARTIGVGELTALTFHERASILRSVGKLLLSDPVKSDLYELSSATGATRADSWIDIEGGAGAALTLASLARKELPNAKVAIDGAPEALSRDGSFIGVHVLSPRRGIEVQINAFNFPVWGMLEKLASAFLAGVPSIVKPAPQTAYLAHAAVQAIDEAGLLPPGSLQLVCADPGDLLDHLDGQDSVAFTGSAATAQALRTHPGLAQRSVHFSAELDSLNAAVLLPSATPDTPEFGLYVKELVSEITTKAGQKCTAIRRALVPESLVAPVGEALEAALADVVVGDPRADGVTMGSVVSTAQQTSVLEAVERIGTAADTIISGGDVRADDPAKGAFVCPTVLRATDSRASVIHEVEAFGPVTTLIGYDGLPDAVEVAALGAGSLVASVFGPDRDEMVEVTLGIASHHGRLLAVEESVASSSTGHGSPLPQLVHGGPGRAGGGQELGGVRSVRAHLQTTAIQGSPAMLTAITGEQMPGAPTSEAKGHPFRLHFDDLDVGDSFTSTERTVTRDDIEEFAHSTGDTFYAHMDEEAAARSPIFGGIVAHGYLVLSYAAGLFVSPEEGPVLANYGIDRLRFATPTRPGDSIHVILTCKRKTRMEGRGYGEVAWDTQVINQNGEVAAAYDVLTMVADLPGVNGAPDR